MPPQRPQPDPVELEPQPGTASGLGLIVETTLVRFLQRVINSVAGLLSEVLGFGLEVFMEVSEQALISINRPMIEYVVGLLPAGSPAGDYLRDMLTPGSFAGAAALGGFATQMGSSAAGNLLSVLMRPLGYELDSQMHTARMDPSMLTQAVWRGLLDPGTRADQAADLGWSPGALGVWEALLRPVLGDRDVMALWVRGEIDEGTARTVLEKRGYEGDVISDMRRVMRPLTGSDDLKDLMYRGILSEGGLAGRLEEHAYDPGQIGEFLATAWRLLGAGDTVELARREKITPAEAIARLEKWGYEPAVASEILEVGRPLTGMGEIIQLFWREALDDEGVFDRLKERGFSDSQVGELLTLSELIPNPQDLISMAVREAFSPGVVDQFNYLAEFPSEFGEWMEKQGYSEEWAQKYWVAHWRLPSLSMAYEMFHREIITEEELGRLFAVSDIAPFWRDKLQQAAYRPLTRVDVRRMYQLGVLDRDSVTRSYLDLGYSPGNAELMTQFTEQYSGESERAATKADILKALRVGALEPSAAAGALQEIGYSEDWAGFHVSMELYKDEQELIEMDINLLEDQYIDSLIDRSKVYTTLGGYDLPSGQIEAHLRQWDVKKRRKVALPSVGQLESQLKQGIIGEGTFTELLERRHYESDTIGHFLQEIRLEMATAAQEAQERANRESRRVAEKAVKSEYEVIKAGLDLQIAGLQLEIAETKVLIGQLTDYDLIDALFGQIDEWALIIKALQEDKARAKLEWAEDIQRIGA